MSGGAAAPFRVGVDIGGTFTDVVFLRPDGLLDKRKVPSTPADYSQAIIDGMRAFCRECGVSADRVAEFTHATTVATNAILERKGARAALLATEGFRDVLELRRIRIPLSYNLDWEKPAPLVERALRFPVKERVNANGEIVIALDRAALEPILAQLQAERVQSVAVCFLHSYRNPAHEKMAGKFLRERLPGVAVSLSCEVLPEMLEFERTSTTVVNAYVAPLITSYLEALRARLSECGIRAPLLVMQSNGGLTSAVSAMKRPVTIIESGPAAGVVAAARLACECGYPNVITLDMGGTTTKASIIERGKILRATEYEVGSPVSVSSRLVRGSGYLIRIPVIDVSEVGAGGGSIARLDAGGALRVGPRSAGALPGPACYAQGNDDPTVTDANLVLGYLAADSLAGGSLKVNRALAVKAVQARIATPAGFTLLDAAFGIHTVANSNMVRAIKSVSVERGRDPADFVMVAFGGAGPVHAAGVAEELGIGKVLIPPAPGVFSAFGLLRAQVEHHAAHTVLVSTADLRYGEVEQVFADLRRDLMTRIRDEGFAESAVQIVPLVDLRYRGQSSEITVPLGSLRVTAQAIRDAEEAFEAEFERTYGHRGETKEFELVTCRLVVTVARGIEHGANWIADAAVTQIRGAERDIYFGGERGMLRTKVLSRLALAAGACRGPAIIQEYDTTVVVPPGWAVALDGHGNILMERRT
ncbi:MAG: hydantoinase/oxoprolinase family protein [Betaproteobacteria bacterium]|nr:hydantoinase/oxoprolinase family protein [Betaproteobacteria bacterium]